MNFKIGLFCAPSARRRQALVVLVFGLALEGIGGLSAATIAPGFAETVIPSGGTWTEAVGLAFGNTGRMFVWERGGRVWLKDPAETSFSLLLDISQEVGGYNDLGLLGFALDPNFESNGYIYLLYNVDRHHLLYFGTTNYNSGSNEYFAATIGRLTRYTCISSNGFRSVDPASRLILIGETKETGFPICTDTQGTGSLVFGTDGTLLVSCGDAASAWTHDAGGTNDPIFNSYAAQALTNGIIRPKEDVGSYRAQLVDCLGGKIIRIDPATGDGIPNNPYYDLSSPRSPRSRVWALGFRNPFRMSLRPESGSHNVADGNPGVLYVGNVGHETWEPLDVVTGPGQNFGWPIYEGLELLALFNGVNAFNLDAPNPFYPTNGCSQYFIFRDLLNEDTLDSAGQPPFVNPCDTSQRIPGFIPQFLRARPVLDWNHTSAITRTPTYGSSGQAQTANVGAPGSPVAGTQFRGNSVIGGTWYTGTNFPAPYQNTYFVADWGQGWIKSMTFDQNDKPVEVRDFLSGAGLATIASVVENPTDGSLYYIVFDRFASAIRRISYVGNRTPVVVGTADKYYGPGPLTVQFSSNGSFDPDGGPLAYAWDFGDGSVTNLANPLHTFSASVGVPTKFAVTLTVTDTGGLSAQKALIVSVNNTPPNVTITSPVDGAVYSPTNTSTVNLTATVSDAESNDSQLLCRWQTLLHHNDHNHGSPPDTNHVTTTVIEPTRCDATSIFYYRILLTVTDPAGLSTTREVRLYPNCGANTVPVISVIGNQSVYQDQSTGPITFSVGDAETVADLLQLSASSSNPTLVPDANIVLGGSGSNRTLTVTPTAGQTGMATINVTVNDGPNYGSTNFVLTVNPPPAGTTTSSNLAPITIPDVGPAAPYPSYINVSGMGGTITNVTVTLRNLTHTYKSDVDVLLVSPGGQKVMLMSDAGAVVTPSGSVTLTLSDAAAANLPASTAISSGTYKPTNYTDDSPGGDNFPAPTPAAPYATTLSTFNGTGANGPWSLYVFDDGTNDLGSFAGGWDLTVATASATGAAPAISNLPNQSTTVNTATAAIPFTIYDGDTPVTSLTLRGESSNLALVPTNNIIFGGNGTNRTVTVTPAANQTGSATIAITVTDESSNWSSAGFVLTVKAVNTPPTLAPVSNRVLNAGQVLLFTNSASDTDLPPQALTFSLLNFPTGATLNPTSGLFTWRPAVAQADTTNLIQLKVADNGSPVMSATRSFTVTVNHVTSPSLAPIGFTNRQFKLLIAGDAGPDYTVQASTNLTTWINLFTTNSPTLPFTWTFSNSSDFPRQFFRILLAP